MTTIKTAVFAALALTFAAPTFAAGFVVDVHGSFTTSTRVGNVSANANGEKAKADINVAGVQGSAMVDYTTTVNAGNIATSATGTNASSMGNIGGVQGYTQ